MPDSAAVSQRNEEGQQLSSCVGTPITLSSRDDAQNRQQIMGAIGRMLPASM